MRVLNVVAHQDDDLLFLNPSISADIAAGWQVRTVFVTAGDAGMDAPYWRGREDGARAAYAQMADVDDSWDQSTLMARGRPLALSTLTDRADVSLVFLRLPDGNLDASGFTTTGGVSLWRLWSGASASVGSVDGTASYTRSTLVATLAALIGDFAPDIVRMLDFVGVVGDGDHPDHHASAYFAHAAVREHGGVRWRLGHQGYPVAARAQNLGAAQVQAKLDTFLTYAAHDPLAPQSPGTLGDYGAWVARRYTVGTGNIAPLSTATASSADASTGQTAARAVDAVISGYPDDDSHEWATTGEGADSWITLTWTTPHTLRRVVLYDRPNADDTITAGTILPGGAAPISTGPLAGQYAPTIVDLPDPTVTTLTLRIDAVAPTTMNIGLAEIEAHEANIAPEAVASASSQNTTSGQTADRATDGHAAGFPADPQREWATIGGGAESWLNLTWATPRRVDRVVLHDRPNPDDHITAARLSFSNGTTVHVGELDPTGGPTQVTFPARTITWLTLTITAVASTTQNIGLAEIQVHGD